MRPQNKLDATFSALGDATRRAIIERLLEGETPLSTLAEPFDMSQTAVSRHVTVLRDAGIVIIEKRGRTRHCRLDPAVMVEAADWLETYRKFWADQFGALATHLESRKAPQ